MADLRVTVQKLQDKVAALLQQDGINRNLLDKRLKDHQIEIEKLQGIINNLTSPPVVDPVDDPPLSPVVVGPVFTPPSPPCPEDEIELLKRELEKLRRSHEEEVAALQRQIADTETEIANATADLETVLEELDELSKSQKKVEELLR